MNELVVKVHLAIGGTFEQEIFISIEAFGDMDGIASIVLRDYMGDGNVVEVEAGAGGRQGERTSAG